MNLTDLLTSGCGYPQKVLLEARKDIAKENIQDMQRYAESSCRLNADDEKFLAAQYAIIPANVKTKRLTTVAFGNLAYLSLHAPEQWKSKFAQLLKKIIKKDLKKSKDKDGYDAISM